MQCVLWASTTAHDRGEYNHEFELKPTDIQNNTNTVEQKETERLRDLGYL